MNCTVNRRKLLAPPSQPNTHACTTGLCTTTASRVRRCDLKLAMHTHTREREQCDLKDIWGGVERGVLACACPDCVGLLSRRLNAFVPSPACRELHTCRLLLWSATRRACAQWNQRALHRRFAADRAAEGPQPTRGWGKGEGGEGVG